MSALNEGQNLGPYVVGGLLGRGGMAEVYRGHHSALEREVAIKVLNPALNVDPTFPLRFLREAKTSAKLSHPNIITVYDFGEHGSLAYLVMELATGGTYEDRVGRLATLRDAVDVLAPVCDALQYAHGQGIIHRDLKPENILVDANGRALLADFGLARMAVESLDLSEAGMIVGTPHYMAPEQALGGKVDHRADVYALGIVTYTVITGRVPFEGKTFFAIIQQHLKSPPPDLRMLLPDAPARLDAAIKRATAKQPEGRFPNVGEFVEELRQAVLTASDQPIGAAAVAAESDRPRPTISAARRAAAPVDTAIATTCARCSSEIPAGDRFCRRCGALRPAAIGEEMTDATSVMTAESLAAEAAAAGDALPPARGAITDTAEPEPPTGPRRKRRRLTSFSSVQWALIGAAAFVVIFINAVGLWLTRAGRSSAGSGVFADITTYIFDNLPWFKSYLTFIAVLLAGFSLFSMRTAIVDNHNLAPSTYRALRRFHRLAGYSAVTIAFAIGLLTCIGIFGFAVDTPRRALHSVLGTALLVVIVAKIGVVRYFPAQRQYLKLFGESVFVLFVLVTASSAVAWIWEQLYDGASSTYYSLLR